LLGGRRPYGPRGSIVNRLAVEQRCARSPHEHDQDGVKSLHNIPFMFDSHFGGSWGTTYKGFRVVEMVKEKSFLTYLMNPTEKINQASF
jgi:hypothetical protein